MSAWRSLHFTGAFSAALIAASLLLGSWYSNGGSTRLLAAESEATRLRGARLSTAVPSEGDRLFGSPLEPVLLGYGSAIFEPAAYRQCAVARLACPC